MQSTNRKNMNRNNTDFHYRISIRKRKARARVRKMIAYSVLTIMTILMLGIFIHTIHSKADSDGAHKFKYYTGMTVSYGDTLWGIAEEYMDTEMYSKASYISEIRSINHIHEDDELIAGTLLIIPYYSADYITD